MADKEQSSKTNETPVSKPFGASAGVRLWLAALGSSLVALLIYGCTLSGYLYPGFSSDLYVQWMGLDALSLPLHPIWGALVKSIGGGTVSSLHMFSAVCGALSAGFICYLVGFFAYQTIGQEDSFKFVGGASLAAGITSAFVFTFSTAAWLASTHLNVRQFDVFLALSLFMLFIPLVRFPRTTYVLSPLLGFAVGVCLLESPIFVPLMALYFFALITTVVKNGIKFYVPAALFLVSMVGGFILALDSVSDAFLALPGVADGELADMGDVLWAIANSYKQEIHDWLFRPGCLVVVLLAVLPFIACSFASVRALNNDRTWSQYAFHGAMTVCCVLATVTPLAPEALLRPFGVVPVATTVLVAVVCGYLVAYWYLVARVQLPAAESSEYDEQRLPAIRFGRKAAPIVGGTLVGLLALAALVSAFGREGDRGEFADVCANEILDRMGDRKWLITDGLLDSHLRLAAAARRQEVNIVCIKARKESEYNAYCRQLADLVVDRASPPATRPASVSRSRSANSAWSSS